MRPMLKIESYSPKNDATAWYRIQFPLQALAEKGLAGFKMHFAEDTSISLDNKPDIAIFQRTGLFHLELMRKLKADGVKIIFDCDDDLPNLDPTNPANLIISPSRETAARHHIALLNSPRMDLVLKDFAPFLKMKTNDVAMMATMNFDALIMGMKIADLTTVSTESLRKTYRGWGIKNIVVLPNMEKESEWRGVVRAPLLSRVVIGWAGGISHAFTDIEPIVKPVTRVLKENPQVHLHLIGVAELKGKFFTDKDIQDRIFCEAWSDWETYKTIIAEFDIALAPSYAKKRFAMGKSDIRCLQSWMNGIPVLASGLTYGESVRRSRGGVICNTEREWLYNLNLLVGNPDLRRAYGKCGKDYMESRVYETNTNLWVDTYRALLK